MPFSFSASFRLTHRRQFDAVYKPGVRTSAGPLTVWAAPNSLDHPRLGMSIPRHVGNAVARNRIRRLIRESFRHLQDDWPAAGTPQAARSYDLVVGVRRHQPLQLVEYRRALATAIGRLHRVWSSRQPGQDNGRAGPPGR